MKNTMDHERCSELLLPYVNGELSGPERAGVEEHLAGCTDCAEEKTALERVLGVEVVGLSDDEREALQSSVSSRLDAERAGRSRDVFAPESRRPWFGRAYPVLGAVALLALLAVFAVSLLSGGGDSGETLQLESGGGGGQPGAEGAGDASEGGSAVRDLAGKAAVPYFKSKSQRLDQGRLTEIARDEVAFRALAGTEADKAGSLRNDYTTELANQAPANAKEQVAACVDSVVSNQDSVVPAFGAQGKYDGKDALILGFVSGSDSGPLNRYMLWLWPKGSCEVPLDYVSGPIKK
jgi:hypothetical protein